MSEWQMHPRGGEHTVVGDLRVWRGLHSPQLNNARDVLVWLPADYAASDRRYPVLYMHDGQNLFDRVGSYSGEWEVDETMTALAAEGLAAIIVGLPNAGDRRRIEYSPYDYELGGRTIKGEGDAYIRFLVETVKPFIDAQFRTRTDAAATGIAGSSMGGLISLYGFLTRPDVFGLCGAFSTAYWFGVDGLYQTTLARADGHGRVYLDVGTREGATLNGFDIGGVNFDQMYCDGVRLLRDALLQGGYESGRTLMYVEDEGAPHNEPAWARRLPDALRFLLRDLN